MTTIFRTVTTTKEHSRWRSVLRLGGAASAAALALSLIGSSGARGQVTPLQIALTETHSNGCVTVHPAGSVFFETKGEIHNAANQTAGVAEVYATFLSPAGAQPLIPEPNPGGVCHGGDR